MYNKFGHTLVVCGLTLIMTSLLGAATIGRSNWGGKVEIIDIKGHEYIATFGGNLNGACIIHSHSCKCLNGSKHKIVLQRIFKCEDCKCEDCKCEDCKCEDCKCEDCKCK